MVTKRMRLTLSLPMGILLMTVGTGLQRSSAAETDRVSAGVEEASPFDFLRRDWYADNGVELPRQFGIGYNLIGMERDIEVVDVNVSFLNLPPQSVSDLADFDVENRTTLSMARIDAWVLPFLDVYLMVGETRTDTSVSTTFMADPPGSPPEEVTVVSNQKVNGPLYGAGCTLVYGGQSWFCMADANYSKSDLDSFDGTIDAWYLSSRLGWHTTQGNLQYKLWGGVAYLDAARTLTLSVDHPVLGTITVEVEQRPSNPWNAAIGGSVGINNRWDLMAEYGSNFSDAQVLVLSAAYRL